MTPTEIDRLRGLLDGDGPMTGDERNEVYRQALPDLLSAAECLRDLAPLLRDVVETGTPELSRNDRDAARRALAVLESE